MRNKLFILLTVFLAASIFIPVISSDVTDNWNTEIVWEQTWQTSDLSAWEIRGDPHATEFGDYYTTVNTGLNYVRLSASSNSSTKWYGCEMKSLNHFNLSKEFLRVTFKFNAPSFNYSNRYAFGFTFWNGSFDDSPINYANENVATALYFRVETTNETHANFQMPLQWNQTTNPLPYAGENNVTCIISQNTQDWYVNNEDYGTGLIGGLTDGFTETYIYLCLEEYGNQTLRYIDFYSITVESYDIAARVASWPFNRNQNWTISTDPIIRANASFPIFNDPSIILVNETYILAHSISNGTYSEIQVRNSSDGLTYSQVISVIPNAVKPWLSPLQTDGYYYCFYSVAGGHANRSRTTDFLSWTQLSSGLSPTANEWDASGTFAPYLIKKGSIWYLYYYGGNNTNPVDRIGFATATVLNGTFTKYAGNPVITPSKLDSFVGEYGCLSSTIVQYGNFYYNFYNSYSLEPIAVTQERGIMCINLARSSDLISWDKLGYPFLIPQNLDWEWKTLLGSPAYLSMNESLYLFVNAFNVSSMENIGYFVYTPVEFDIWDVYMEPGLLLIGIGMTCFGSLSIARTAKDLKDESSFAVIAYSLVILLIGISLIIGMIS